MGKSGTTLRDIAKAANVSVATVSYTLNGKPGRVSDAKRTEIQHLLEKSGLKARHVRKPALYVINEQSFNSLPTFGPFFQKYQGLNAECHRENVALRLEFLRTHDPRGMRPQLQDLMSHRPGAVILDSNLRGSDSEPIVETARFFQKRGVAVIQVGHTVEVPGAAAVIIDDFSGAYEGTRHLIQQGHTRIATIRWKPTDDQASGKKHAGFIHAMEEAGLPIHPEYIVDSPPKRSPDTLPGRVAVAKLLALPEPPTAVFVENSFVSAPLIYPMCSDEEELPPEIAALDMVHFEARDLEFVEEVMAGMFRYASRKTKLLQVNWEQVGRVAAKFVIDQMRGQPDSAEVIRLAPQLVEAHGETIHPL